MKTVLFSVLILLLLFCEAKGEQPENSPADTAAARMLADRGWKLETAAKYDSAIILFDTAGTIYARANATGGWVRCLNGKATCLRLQGKYDKALEVLSIGKGIEDKLAKEEPFTAAQRLVTLGSIYLKQGKYDTALVSAKNALTIQSNFASSDTVLMWDTYSLFAGVYSSLGYLDTALEYNRRAIELFRNPQGEQRSKVSNSYNSIAIIYESLGDYRKALEYFTRTLEIQRTLRGEKHPDVGRVYGNVAVAYFRLGDYDLALEYYQKSLNVLHETAESDHPSFGIAYNNIAMAYRSKGEFGKALEYGKQSKAIFVKKLGEKHPNVAGVVNNIGRTYSDMGQYKKALEAYREALLIWEEKLGRSHPNVTQSYFNIGEALGKSGDARQGISWLKQSLLVRRETLGEKNVKVAQSLNGLGAVYANWRKPDSALYYYQHAIIALVEDFADSNVTVNPAALKSRSDLDLLTALSGKADAFRLRYNAKRTQEDLTASLDTYEYAARLAETIRRGYTAEGSKIQLGEAAFTIYEKAIAVCLKLFDLTKDAAYYSNAFSFAERSKAGILQDAISESQAKQFAGIPDTLLEEEHTLRIDLAYRETQIQKEKEKNEKTDSSKIIQWQNAAFDLQQRFTGLIGTFEKDFPEYYALKHKPQHVSLTEIQEQVLDKKSALLEYVVTDGEVIIFAVTKHHCTVKTQPLDISLTTLVKEFRRSIQNVDDPAYIRSARSLYAYLVAPVIATLNRVDKLYIIPDGILNYLPFEALLTKKVARSARAAYAQFPYLLRKFEISYQASAELLLEHKEKTDAKYSSIFSGFAPVFADHPPVEKFYADAIRSTAVEKKQESKRVTRSITIDGERFAELPESENEVNGILKLFKARHQSAAVFLHQEADESRLKSPAVSMSRFIHIASHGIINEEKPKLSGIIFAASGDHSSEDGILYSGEIYNLKLNADLVVLSACETGLGTIVKGEGILGLTRGFMYAGAQHLLVSLWQVADKSTSDVMIEFYRNVLKGQEYSSALRNAKLTMIKRGKYSHPVEWSPFVLTGK